MQTKSQNPLGTEHIPTLLRQFSIPAMVGMMVSSLYNVVDRMFIGNSPDLGAEGLAGITIAFPLMIILLSIGLLFGIGGATLFSMKLGEGVAEEAEAALGNAFFLLVAAGLLFMVLGQLFLAPLLQLFGASDAVLPHAMAYMRVIFFGAVFQTVSLGMNNFIRADGSPKIAMYTMFLGAGVNILLDWVFIYGLRMGMAGAALATVLAQFLSALWVVTYFLGSKSRVKLRLEQVRFHPVRAGWIAALGMSSFLLQLANSVLHAILNRTLLHYGGDMAVSAMGIIQSLQMILLLPVVGIKHGMQPIVSFNYGARQYARVRRTALLAIAAASMVVGTGYGITRLFPETIIRLFNQDTELVAFGARMLTIWFLFLPVTGFQIIASSYFQAIGKVPSAMFLTLTRQVILLIPAILLFPRFFGLEGLLHAAPFADFFSAFLTGFWFLRGLRRLQEMADARTGIPPTSDDSAST